MEHSGSRVVVKTVMQIIIGGNRGAVGGSESGCQWGHVLIVSSLAQLRKQPTEHWTRERCSTKELL